MCTNGDWLDKYLTFNFRNANGCYIPKYLPLITATTYTQVQKIKEMIN